MVLHGSARAPGSIRQGSTRYPGRVPSGSARAPGETLMNRLDTRKDKTERYHQHERGFNSLAG